MVVAVMIGVTAHAQMANNLDMLVEVDEKQVSNLPIGLDPRVSVATDQPVEWSKSQYGFAASYRLDNTYYMATYNQESHYVETYKKVDWNSAEVSSVVKQALLVSSYKNHEVVGYWVSSDPEEYGYYLEIKDKTGKQSAIWADTKGNFYNRPYEYSITPVAGE